MKRVSPLLRSAIRSSFILACAGAATLMAQAIEDKASAPSPGPAVSDPAEEGTRRISADISAFSTLRASAIGATAIYIIGMGFDYGLIPVTANISPDDSGSMMLMLIPELMSGALRLSSAPAACVQASKAYDRYSQLTGTAPYSTDVWKWYGIGWVFYGAASVSRLIATYGHSSEATLFSLMFVISSDALWTIACFKSIAYVRELEGDHRGRRISLVPLFGPHRTVGISLALHF
jgi:hypothetical protein